MVLARQLVRTLQGLSEGPATLSGPGFDERAFEEALPTHPLPLIQTWFYLFKLEAQVFGGDFDGALATAEWLGPTLPLLRG